MEEETKRFRSLIKEFFPTELCVKLDALTVNHSFLNNNHRSVVVRELLNEYKVPWTALGNGTNRYGIKVGQYAVKIALDRAGRIDNLREFKYTKAIYPDAIKVYETTIGNTIYDSGLIAVSEYLEPFSQNDLMIYDVEMRKILAKYAPYYLIGDVGISTDNYANWGIRDDGSIAMLDFAYIYSLSYRGFQCTCDDEGMLEYDKDFNYLICPFCRKKWAFRDLRKRITKDDEEKEIGDITTGGYLLHDPVEHLRIDPRKSPVEEVKEKKEKKPKVILPKNKVDDITEEKQQIWLKEVNDMLSHRQSRKEGKKNGKEV